jgi:multiple sugar transport system permease protein
MNLPPHFFPETFFINNYLRIFSSFQYIRFFLNSFIVSLGTVSAVFLIAIPAGYSFSRYFFKGKQLLLTSIMSVQMFPIVVILISLYSFYMKWRLLNTYQGLILADTTFALPLSIMLMKSFFDTLPRSLDESARIDGAGRMQTLFSILLPLTKPGLVASGIYTFLNSWDDYLLSLTIMQKVDMKTITIGLAQSFLGEYAYDYGALMAFSIFGSLPIVLFFIAFQKYMISGLTAGAVKG